MDFIDFVVAALLLLACQPAFAEKRVALVLGNSAYQNVAPLANPVNDGAVIASTLKDAGFDVVDSRHDLPAAETRRALRDFADRARDADIAVVYYAGHGIEVDGTNYLIPVDAKLERDTDVYDEALSLDRVLVAVEPAKQLRLVILDACRDNPFAKTMKRTVASRAIGQRPRQGRADQPEHADRLFGQGRLDRRRRRRQEQPVHDRAVAASDDARARRAQGLRLRPRRRAEDHRQPAGAVRLRFARRRRRAAGAGAGRAAPAAAPRRAANPQADVRRDYELALQIGNKSALNAFLAQYPDGFYASLAKLQLDKIAAEEARVAATEKARLAEQERARLAAEGAQKAQQAKAEADAKAAEQARIAAEKAKQVAQDQAAAAEQQARRRRKDCCRQPGCRGRAGEPSRRRRNLAALSAGAAAGRRHQVGADRAAPRRLPQRGRRWRMERGVAAFADAVQPLCRDQARHQAGQRPTRSMRSS